MSLSRLGSRRFKVLTALGPAAVVLALASGAVAADPPSLSATDPSVTEGDSGTKNATFVVSLSAASIDTVTVDYATADSSATARADYTPTSGTLTFAPGETSKAVTVLVAGDTMDEHHETFFLNLSNPNNASLAELRGIATILDNDALPTLSISDASATEGDPASFTANLSAPSGKTIVVNYATGDGSATARDDYSATSGTLTFAPGETSRTLAVATTEDRDVEFTETFQLNLFNPTNATLADLLGTGTVTDDDDLPPTPEPPPPPPTTEPPPPPPGEEPPAEEPPAESPANAAPDCSGVEPSTRRLWPPNHKFKLVTLRGATDADGDSLALEVTGVTQDEPVGGHGRYRGPDARWTDRADGVELRAERDSKGDGRAYRLEFTVRDGQGGQCSGTALAGVQHDKNHRWLDSGATFDSFAG
jgi:Calx-beta domain